MYWKTRRKCASLPFFFFLLDHKTEARVHKNGLSCPCQLHQIPETFSYKAEDVKKLVEKKKEASSVQFSLTREKQLLMVKIKAIEDNMDMLGSQENFGIDESETLKELEKLKNRLGDLEEKISLKQEYETAADEQVMLLTIIHSEGG